MRSPILIGVTLASGCSVITSKMVGYAYPSFAAADCSQATALKDNCIVKDIQSVVDFLSVGVGVIVVGVIILGGIQYSIAGDNPQAITAAKQRIINGLIALVAYMLSFAFLQWIIPGGIFG